MKKNYYAIRKEEIREAAIEWQLEFINGKCDWLSIADAGTKFEKLGRRFGLLREFHENGIC